MNKIYKCERRSKKIKKISKYVTESDKHPPPGEREREERAKDEERKKCILHENEIKNNVLERVL